MCCRNKHERGRDGIPISRARVGTRAGKPMLPFWFQHQNQMSFIGNESFGGLAGWKYLAGVFTHDSHTVGEQPTQAVGMGTALFGNAGRVSSRWN